MRAFIGGLPKRAVFGERGAFYRCRIFNSSELQEDLIAKESILHSYPDEFIVKCKKCMMLLSFPLEENQPDNYAPSEWAKPDPRVICTAQTVFFPEDYHETGILPTMK